MSSTQDDGSDGSDLAVPTKALHIINMAVNTEGEYIYITKLER
jgi:hypothetical protein